MFKNIINIKARIFICSNLYRCLLASIILFLTWSHSYAEDKRYFFNIPSQALDSAIDLLAKQADISILGKSVLIEGKQGADVVGEMTILEALEKLLGERSIHYDLVQDQFVVLTRKTKDRPTIFDVKPKKKKVKDAHLEEVIVYSRDFNVFSSTRKMSNTFISKDDLNHRVFFDLGGLRASVPGFQQQTIGEHNVPKLFIRGIGTFDHTEAGDQSITLYTDGIYNPRPQNMTAMIFDAESVETLRGPQVGEFGRSSIGGSINIHNRRPHQNLEAQSSLIAGSKDRLNARLAVNLPISSKWALRFSAAADRRRGDIKFADKSITARPYGTIEHKAYRISSLFEPRRGIEWLTSYEQYTNTGTGTIAVEDGGVKVDQTTTPGFVDFKQRSFRSRVETYFSNPWQSSQNIVLTYLTGASHFDQSQLWAPSKATSIDSTPWSSNTSIQHEIQLSNRPKKLGLDPHESKHIDWRIGAFYLKEKNKIRFDRQYYTPLDEPFAVNHIQTSFFQPDRRARSDSLYGQIQLPLAHKLKATLALRYNNDIREDKNGKNIFCSRYIDGEFPETAPEFSQRMDESCWVDSYNDVKGRWDKFTQSALLDWSLSKNTSLLASYVKGWKPGSVVDGEKSEITGGQVDRRANQQRLLNAEQNQLTEFGINYQSPTRDLNIRSSIFYMKHNNIQTFAFAGGDNENDLFRNANGGSSHTRGMEFDLHWDINLAWQLRSTTSYLDARFSSLVTRDQVYADEGRYWNSCAFTACQYSAINLKGNRLPFSPKYTQSTTLNYTWFSKSGAKLRPELRFYYQSLMYLSPENRKHRPVGFLNSEDPGEAYIDAQKAYSKIDFSLRYVLPNDQWSIDLFINNLTNVKVKTGALVNADEYKSAYFWEPERSFSLRLSGVFR